MEQDGQERLLPFTSAGQSGTAGKGHTRILHTIYCIKMLRIFEKLGCSGQGKSKVTETKEKMKCLYTPVSNG